MNRKLRAKIIENFGSQQNFAGLIGCYDSRISQIIYGKRNLPVKDRRMWAKLLNTKEEELFREA